MSLRCETSARRPGLMQGTRMRRDPFDQSPLRGNGLHVGRAKQFGGHFPPQLPLVSTPAARWQGDPGAAQCGSAPGGLNGEEKGCQRWERGFGSKQLVQRKKKKKKKGVAISNLEGRQQCIKSCGEGLTSA